MNITGGKHYQYAAWVLMGVASFMLLFSFAPQQAYADHNADEFKAGRIIDDSVFTDTGSMSTQDIKSFLIGKNSTCLKDYKSPEPLGNNKYGDNVSAAKVIKKSAKLFNLNPQVLIVTLQKEQGLVTRGDCPSWRYKTAMGFGCPDGEPCNSKWYGFSRQMYQGARHLRGFYDQNDGWYIPYVPGDNYILWYPDASRCGGSNVNIKNRATASLYSYTPYQPNKAALDAGYGSGDSCSSYGNRNFFLYFSDWFGGSLSSILFKVKGSATYYLDWGEYYYPIPSEDVLYAYGLQGHAPRTVGQIPENKMKGSALKRVAKFGSDDQNSEDFTALVNIVDRGKRHGLPNYYTLKSHGYSGWANYDPELKYLLKDAKGVRPVVRKPNGAIMLFEDGKRRGFPDYETFDTLVGPDFKGNEKPYSEHSRVNMSHRYVDLKSLGAPMLLSGKFFTSKENSSAYLYDDNKLYAFDDLTYDSWGNLRDYTFSQAAIDQIPTEQDGSTQEADQANTAPILVKSGEEEKYLVDLGAKYKFSEDQLGAWGVSEQEFTLVSGRTLDRLSGKSLSNLIQPSGSPGVYYVEKGERHGVPSLKDFNGLGFSWSDVQEASKSTLNLLPRGANIYVPGSLVRKPNGAVLLTDEDYVAHGVTSGKLFNRFGFKWSDVRSVGENALNGYETGSLLTLLEDNSNNRHHIIENGVRHYLDEEAMSAKQYNFITREKLTVNANIISLVDKGKDLTRFLRGSGPTVFYIENGKKRPFTTEESFRNKGGSWDKVIDVSDEFLDEIPRGKKL